MQPVAAGVCHVRVQTRDPRLSLSPPLRRLPPRTTIRALPPRRLTPQLPQLALGVFEVFRVRHHLTGGQDSRNLTPRSTPTTDSGSVGAGSDRSTSTEKDTNQRPARNDTVADRIRAVPAAMRRASLRVDSWVRTIPIRGSFTCRRSVSTSPNAPVVNRHDNPARLPLNLGKRTLGPFRFPDREDDQFASAVARFASPEE